MLSKKEFNKKIKLFYESLKVGDDDSIITDIDVFGNCKCENSDNIFYFHTNISRIGSASLELGENIMECINLDKIFDFKCVITQYSKLSGQYKQSRMIY